MATDKPPLLIRFQPDTLEKIKYIAKQMKRSASGQLEYLAEQCIAEFEKENGPIEIPPKPEKNNG